MWGCCGYYVEILWEYYLQNRIRYLGKQEIKSTLWHVFLQGTKSRSKRVEIQMPLLFPLKIALFSLTLNWQLNHCISRGNSPGMNLNIFITYLPLTGR